MAASLTEKELERLRLELWRRRAGGHMTMALSLDTVDALLASARAMQRVEAALAELADDEGLTRREAVILAALTATAEPTDGEER